MMMDGSLPLNLLANCNNSNIITNMRHPSTSSSIVSPGKGSEEGHSSSDSHQYPPSTNSRSCKVPKICGVCGDRAKSFHFGGLACDSCKAFFRRSVHNDAYTAFRCAYQGFCNIIKSTRKGCQKCRFEKCLSIGMEKNWVMSEQERSLFNQQRMKKKKEAVEGQETKSGEEPITTTNTKGNSGGICGGGSYNDEGNSCHQKTSKQKQKAYEPELGNMIQFMTDVDQTSIKKVVEDYRLAYSKIPYRVPHETDGPRQPVQIIEMFTTILRRFAYFCTLVPEFQALSRDDQGKLLRESVLEMCLLRGALSFDAQNHRWPNTSMEFLKDCPQLNFNDVENLVDPELHTMHIEFIRRMQLLKVDEPTMMLLLMVVLFYPDTVVSDQKACMDADYKYLDLLQKYVNWRYGPQRGPRLFPHLLIRMIDLRHLNDIHTVFNLKLAQDEVKAIQEELAKLKIDRLEALSPETLGNPDEQGSVDDDVEFLKSQRSVGAKTTSPTTEFSGMPINTSDILEHTTGRATNTAQPPPRSPRHIKQRIQNCDPQKRSVSKRPCSKNPMAEVFLRRIPALIENPLAPMVTESEIMRFREVLASGGAGPLQLPTGFDTSLLMNRFAQSSSGGERPSNGHPFTFPGSRESLLAAAHHHHPSLGNLMSGIPTIPPSAEGGFNLPISHIQGQFRPNLGSSLDNMNLPPHELEMAKRIQESLSPERRAELRALFFPGGGTAPVSLSANNTAPAADDATSARNFVTAGDMFGNSLQLSPQQLQSLISRNSPCTTSAPVSIPITGYGGGGGGGDLSGGSLLRPMSNGPPPAVSLRNIQAPTVISHGPGSLASSPSAYHHQVHPQVRVGDPLVKTPQWK